MEEHINIITPHRTVDYSRLDEVGSIDEGEMLHQLRKFKEKAPGPTDITKNVMINITTNIVDTL